MITFDFETKSYADLKKVGTWCYAEHPTTEVICCAYKIDDRDIQTWWPGKDLISVQKWPSILHSTKNYKQYCQMPFDLFCALTAEHEIEAWNVAFEKAIWLIIMAIDFGWLIPDDEQWRDTMATACYYALPAALDRCSRVLGFEGKNPEGSRLISKYSKLYLKTANEDIPPEDFDKFVGYCCDDVLQEWKISDFLGDLPEDEQQIWFMDQRINERGLFLDDESIRDAMHVVEQRSAQLAEDYRQITGVNPTQRDKSLEWFANMGTQLDNLQAEYIEEVLDGHHEDVELGRLTTQALEIRKAYNKASVKKLQAMLFNRAGDGRARFQTRYHGAGPGRWTGTGFQPLNLKRSFEHVPPDNLIKDISYRSPRWLDAVYGDAMEAVSKSVRHMITAQEGNRIIAGDYTSIEAVVMCCLADERWKIEAFRNGDPLYELMGCEIHKLGPEAEALARTDKKAFKDQYPDERFDGKTGELAFQYQGNLGAWRKFDSKPYTHSDERVREICATWRAKHPATVQFWRDLDEAAIHCVRTNGDAWVRQIGFEMHDYWMAMVLPDRKRIWYWQPELRMVMPPWHKPEVLPEDKQDKDYERYEDCRLGRCDCEPQARVTYMAQKDGQWRRVYTYGGKLSENACQATSRQILVPAMQRLEMAGYDIILSVYDEIVSEMPIGWGSVEEYAELMRQSPGSWAVCQDGSPWPISVDVWEGLRYKK